MKLENFCFGDPRLVLVPVEHLTPRGVDTAFAAELRDLAAWSQEKIDLLDRAFALYWTRSEDLGRRTPTWAPPRLRNVAILRSGEAIPPYVQLLNTSTWTLYDGDVDPQVSHVELAAYLFVHGERMALTGEATLAALRNAAYWFDRDAAEIAAFQAAARRSLRPDAAAFHALADALEWLPHLAHESLRPVENPRRYRAIPGTGLLVPPELTEEPPRLAKTWTKVANAALRDYYGAWRHRDPAAVRGLTDWLAGAAPPLLVTGKGNRILWDPEHAGRIGALRNELRTGGVEALADIRRDLEVIAAHTHAFEACVVDREALPLPGDDVAQDGYTYLYRGRKILAYNLHEPHLRRLEVPALPFARFMLGARATHEWAHLAVDVGWVMPSVDDAVLADLLGALAECFDTALAAAPPALCEHTRSDVEALRRQSGPGAMATALQKLVTGESAGAALVRMIAPRFSDFAANLLAVRLQSTEEREAYVRQNIRSLRPEYRSTELWRMLARYLYEYQYLRFSEMPNAREVFLRSTWLDADFLASGAIRESDFDALSRSFARLADTYAIDERRFAF